MWQLSETCEQSLSIMEAHTRTRVPSCNGSRAPIGCAREPSPILLVDVRMGAACSAQPGSTRVMVADTTSLASLELFSGQKHPHVEALEQLWKEWLRDRGERGVDSATVVAPAMRWICWPILLHADELIAHDLHGLSSAILTSTFAGGATFVDVAASLKVADRDVPRTAPDLRRMASAHKTLRRALRAAASADHRNAYVQSQNFLAFAMVLAGIRSQSAAACMVALLRTRGCAIGDLYKDGLELPRILARAVIHLLRERVAAAHAALGPLEGVSDVKVLPWVMSCGTGSSLPWSSKLLTMDRLVLEVACAQRRCTKPPAPSSAAAAPSLVWLQPETRSALLGGSGDTERHPARPASGTLATGPSSGQAATDAGLRASRAVSSPSDALKLRSQDRCPPMTVVACALAAMRGMAPQLSAVTRAGHAAARTARPRAHTSREATREAAKRSLMLEGCMSCLQERWLESARRRLQADDGEASSLPELPGPDSKVLVRTRGRKRPHHAIAPAPPHAEPSAAPPAAIPPRVTAAPASPKLGECGEARLGGERARRLDIESSISNSDSEFGDETGLPAETAALPRELQTPHRRAVFRAESQAELPVRLSGRLRGAVTALIRSPPAGVRLYHKPSLADLTVVDGQLCWVWMHPCKWAASLDAETAWLQQPVPGARTRLHAAARSAAIDLGLPVPEWCE